MSYVLALSRIGLDDVSGVGRKAAVLGELGRAGFAVPDGFAVTTGALEDGLAAAGAGRWTADAPLPDGLAGELAAALDRLGAEAVAVRSSGVAEDLAGMSYAGQYESVLDVRGPDALAEAVRTCWASGFSERVRAYRGGDAPEGVGVLVQRMVAARAAGAAFSVNPVTGDDGEVVISAVRGLGERLMSGEVTADEWVVRGEHAEHTSGDQDALTPEQAREVADLARSVAAHLGAPQDIEWVIDDERVWLVQARPITGLPGQPQRRIPIAIGEPPPGFSSRDRNTDRPWVPLQRSIFMPVFSDAARHVFAFSTGVTPSARAIGGWTYVTTPPDTITDMVARVEKIAARIEDGEPERLIREWNEEIKPSVAADLAGLRRIDPAALSNVDLAAHFGELLRHFARMHDVYFRLTGAAVFLFGRLGVACAELLGWDPVRTLRLRGGLTGDHVPATTGLGDLARAAAARPATRALLESGEPLTPGRLRETDPGFADAFDDYVRNYGHRTIGFTLTDPTLAEQPEVLLNLVRAQLDAPYDLAAERARLDARRQEAMEEAREALAGRTDAERERFATALAGSDLGGPVRDEKVFYAVSLWALVRYAALEIGRRLAAAGTVGDAGDVFFLEHPEALAALADHRPRHDQVDRGRGEHAWALAHPGPPFYGTPPAPMALTPGMAPPSAGAEHVMAVMQWSMRLFGGPGGAGQAEAGALRGVAASAGRYTGPARVITSVTEFGKLRRGDVLVCPETTAQWAVLFPSVGALVTDRGSLLSHPAIIAREYGVPAVVATGTATTAFRDDQLLTVDGTTGLVRPAGDP
ncbi:PEP/pyruvate-binding domain-containing protein [Streptosporangium nondiastaticum]|uniref:PEP/pyruvate-binding domain-containing protein n=1 Tax=Streptosporangium nondiastaticum TaxID=35764 RepID=UPI0031F88D63